jgi:hypothetical protein
MIFVGCDKFVPANAGTPFGREFEAGRDSQNLGAETRRADALPLAG